MSATVTRENHGGANLMTVHREWAQRPADERFYSLAEARQAMETLRLASRGAKVLPSSLTVQPEGEDLVLVGSTGTRARFNNWSFGQLSTLAGAPAGFLSELPAPIAADALNFKLAERVKETGDSELQLLVRLDEGGYRLSAVNGRVYSRLWNARVLDWLVEATEGTAWQLPVSRHQIDNGRRVLFASDRDLTVLLEDRENRVSDGTEGGLMRAIVVRNSEVGAAKFSVWAAYLREICGNLILWGVTESIEFAFRHVGEALDTRSRVALASAFQQYHNEPARELESRIARLQDYELAPTREGVVQVLYDKRVSSRQNLESAYTLCEQDEPGLNPRSPWGMAQGLTRASQLMPNMNDRLEIDRAAGKVLSLISF